MAVTPNYGLTKPVVGADTDAWGTMLNGDLDIIDTELFKKADKATAQTPWTQDIEGAGFFLQHAGGVGIGALATASAAQPLVVVTNVGGSVIYTTQTLATAECRFLLSNDVPVYGHISVYGSANVDVSRRNQFVIYATTGIILAPANVNTINLLATGRILVGPATDDGANLAQFAGNVRISSPANDSLYSLHLSKPNGGAVIILMKANDTYSPHLRMEYGPQVWLVGAGLAAVGVPSFDIYDASGGYFPLRCMHNTVGRYTIVEPRLSVGVPAAAPDFCIQVQGAGTSQASIYTPSLNRGNTICILDTTFGGGNGGAVLFGTGTLSFGAIRGCLTDGTAFGLGKLSFLTRTASGTEAMTEAVRVDASGIAVPLMPSSNPGGGSKQLWYDPADGNRVKFAV